jgi:hypothetical protein
MVERLRPVERKARFDPRNRGYLERSQRLQWTYLGKPRYIDYGSKADAEDWAREFRKMGYENVSVVQVRPSSRAKGYRRRAPRRR